MPDARLTIGMPVHNGEKYLAVALGSILDQTFADFKVVIGDNASTDQTEEIARGFAAEDPRVRYFRHDRNLGAAANYNSVFADTDTEFYKWAAHDDVLSPTFFQSCIEALDAQPEAVLAFPRTRIIDEEGNLIRDYDDPVHWDGATPSSRLTSLLRDQWLTFLHMCSPVFGVIRSDALRSTRLIGSYNGSDAVLISELALLGDFAQIDEYLFHRRWHSGMSLAGNPSPESVAEWFEPRSGRRFPMPRTKLLLGHAGAVLRAPISLEERARGAEAVARWLASDRRWRVIGGELKIRGRQALGRSRVLPRGSRYHGADRASSRD